MSKLQFETVESGNIRVHVCSTDKFKTNMMSVMIQQDLTPATVTRHALLPSVLQRGTESLPSTIQLKRQLDELYGAALFGDVFKRGERHIMQIGLDIANEQYLHETSSLLEEGVAFLGNVLYRPLMEGEGFKESYVQAEKKNLSQKIESLMDDKIRYAAHRCIAEMCKGEPFSLFNHGQQEDLDNIDSRNLYTYYRELLESRPMDLYFVGNVATESILKLVEKHFPSGKEERQPVSVGEVVHPVQQVKEVTDRLNVKQGKLNMGCRTQISIRDQEYIPLLVYNGILGGYPHSKLFVNVREKASLAYYASSGLESHKGILTVQSGVEIDNFSKAVDIIRKQFELMAKGEITDNELSQTKAMLTNQLKEQQDRAQDLVHSHYQSILSGVDRPLDEMIEQVHRVDREEIQKVAKKVQLDTIYYLRNQGEGGFDGTD
ncbi:insulinase family protein [Kroppenstedtia pulmonis]|uniref:Insulinase family protein n=1 Tax=Kroppenstedtia pulmonis TaxID=1380685 RepID=A0A7D4CVS6_9BACL|nr:pitrilysin family protein [Kroppenstedtia pulmonis]QKG84537.1 insulinase family protein [Kroppenstedtia pulmonis]